MTGEPLYLELAGILAESIRRGSPQPGDRLPSERSLATKHGVNRQTVRQALDVLIEEGLASRVRGTGTFVEAPRLHREASEFFHFTARTAEQGLSPSSHVLSVDRHLPSASVASDLDLGPEDEVYRFLRLRTIGGNPVVLETFSVPVSLAPGIDAIDISEGSFYELLSRHYDIQVATSRQSLEAVALGEMEADWLETTAGAPAILERRVSIDRQGRPVESGTDLYRGDRVRFTTEGAVPRLRPEAGR